MANSRAENIICIAGLNKSKVLIALYEAAVIEPKAVNDLAIIDPKSANNPAIENKPVLTKENAKSILESLQRRPNTLKFYVCGIAFINIDIFNDFIDVTEYEKMNGKNSARQALMPLIAKHKSEEEVRLAIISLTKDLFPNFTIKVKMQKDVHNSLIPKP